MKRVTSRAKIAVIGISGLLVAGIAVPSAFGTTDKSDPAADGGRRPGAELSVTAGESESESGSPSASATISRPSDRRGPNTLKSKDVTLSSYDAEDGRAVLRRKDRRGKSAGVEVREGDVIASPPTKSAPAGALVKVKDVASRDGGKTELRTSRANLTEVFGGAKADGKVPVSPSAWKVDPLVKGLDVERGAAKAGRDAKGSDLHLDFDTELPDGDESDQEPLPQVDGYLDISPKVDFSYDGHGSSDPADATASIGVGADYKAGWTVNGTVEPDFARRVPVAEVSAHPVIMVGPVPVVVTVKLTLVLKVQADGRIRMDVQKDVNGTVKVGTRYAKESGWEADNQADGTTLPGGRADISGEGQLRTALGPELDVSLYDTVGVTAFLGPYLRATAQVPRQTPGAADGRGTWQLHGGLTLASSLYAQLPFVVIGNRPSKRIDFPPITREWFITKGEF